MKRYICSVLILLGLLVPAVSLAAPAAVGATDIFNGICSGKNDTGTSAGGTNLGG